MSAEIRVEEVISRIDAEIRPKLDRSKFDGGYDCCGCSTYEQIVDDIVNLLREESARVPSL